MNYKEICCSSGITESYRSADSKHPSSGYYLTKEELLSLTEQIENLQYQLIITKQTYERQIAKTADEYAKKETVFLTKISSLQNEVNKIRSEVKSARELNENLLRISRERANSARGLKPKKSHPGFVLISSQERTRIIHSKTGNKEDAYWETTVQTPYSTELSAADLKCLVEDTKSQILSDLGISTDEIDTIHLSERANYRQGFWEFSFKHSNPLKPKPTKPL